LARESGIRGENIMVVENGHVIELDKHGVHIAERVPGGYVFVDGNSVGDVGRAVLRDREILAQDGFVIVVMNVDARTNQLMQDPEIISRGFVYMRDASELIEQIRASAVRLSKDNRKASADALRREVEDGLAAMIYTETRRRPMIFCVVNRV
jgi:ribonuclease J